MLKYLLSKRQARFLLIGIAFTIVGFILQASGNGLSTWMFYIAIVFLGFYATKNAIVDTFKERKPNVDLLMILSALGSIIINYESEGAMLLIIFAAAENLEDYVMSKSSKSIEELMKQVPENAKLILDNGTIEHVPTSSLEIGDRVMVSRGDQIPIDGYLDREGVINEASLTGESLAVTKEKGKEVFAGTINEGDSFVIEVSKLDKDTVFSNIIKMVDQAQNRPSKKQSIIDRIESKYVIGVLIAVPLFILGLMYIRGYSFNESFYRGIVLLTVASPCALIASATPASLSAISNGAKNGILFKDGRAMEIFEEVDIIATDKTGTLTHGDFEVVEYDIPEEFIKDLVIMEQSSNHPIAQGIVKYFDQVDVSGSKHEDIEEIPGVGLQMGDLIVGNIKKNMDFSDPKNILDIENEGNTISHIAHEKEIVGYIALADRLRNSAIPAIKSFKDEGVIVEMLTGDNDKVAAKIADKLGLEAYQASMLPEDKMKFITEEQDKNKTVAMIGDGINDAPALANADIGISMGSGTSIAMESSDLVIVKNDLNKLFHSFKLSQKLNKIIYQNIIFSIGVIIILITLNLLGLLDLPTGVVFHEGSTILVILNGLRLLNFKWQK